MSKQSLLTSLLQRVSALEKQLNELLDALKVEVAEAPEAPEVVADEKAKKPEEDKKKKSDEKAKKDAKKETE